MKLRNSWKSHALLLVSRETGEKNLEIRASQKLNVSRVTGEVEPHSWKTLPAGLELLEERQEGTFPPCREVADCQHPQGLRSPPPGPVLCSGGPALGALPWGPGCFHL